MAFGDFLFGKSSKLQQIPRFSPEQQQVLNSILQQALAGLQAPTQSPTAGFEPIAQQARTQFAQQTIPSLAERFTAFDGQRSSAFQQALGQAGSGLEQALAAQKAQYGLQQQDLGIRQQGLLQNLLGLGLTPQFENVYRPGSGGFLGNLLSPLAQQTSSLIPLLSLLGGR